MQTLSKSIFGNIFSTETDQTDPCPDSGRCC